MSSAGKQLVAVIVFANIVMGAVFVGAITRSGDPAEAGPLCELPFGWAAAQYVTREDEPNLPGKSAAMLLVDMEQPDKRLVDDSLYEVRITGSDGTVLDYDTPLLADRNPGRPSVEGRHRLRMTYTVGESPPSLPVTIELFSRVGLICTWTSQGADTAKVVDP